MLRNLTIIFITIILFPFNYSQLNNPKREFRGAWIATVLNLDWPSSNSLSTDKQKQELLNILDGLKEAGINAVIFQIRSECDAMYASNIEPWSYWLTGEQGKAPNPYYDPLEFVVNEAHKRGMELHAWLNPYRAVRSVGNYSNSPMHVSQQHSDWVLQFGGLKILDPGLPDVRNFVTSVIMDVVRRYDIDGIHFDDYFYQSGITTEDASTFQNYSRGFTNIGEWRRDNVNLLVKEIYDSIHVVKPYVKFGISPPGMWKAGNPPGICGYYGYTDIYADGIHWLQSHTIDYLAPQIYRAIGSSINCGSTDYKLIMNWWSTHTFERHLYIGQGAYRISEWSASELPNQIRLNRNNLNVQGGILFRTTFGILDNPVGFLDSLNTDLYNHPALIPTMNWKDTISPNPPLNLAFGKIGSTGRSGLTWDLPVTASDGDSASRYVVYHFNTPAPQQSDYDNAENIYNVEGSRESFPILEKFISSILFFSNVIG